MTDRDAMRAAFETILRTNAWGSAESVSGPGSERARAALFQAEFSALVGRLGIRSLLDAGCGDLNWIPALDLPLARYVGVDVVPALLVESRRRHGRQGWEFRSADITCDPLPRVDLVFCRDCLVHLPLADVARAMDNFGRSGSTWLLATTFLTRTNVEIGVGDWQPLNLEAAPFNLSPPIALIDERCPPDRGDYSDKRLALWRLDAGFSGLLARVGRVPVGGGRP